MVWRGRRIADPSDLEPTEATAYWLEVLQVARIVSEVFEPCHLNYDLLGNLVPHVHTHIVPRYLDDPSPHTPLKPWEPTPVPDAELQHQAQRLRTARGGA